MLKRLLSIVLTATIILSAFTAFPVSVNAEEATEPTDSAETYSPTEDDSTVTIPTEPATELESEKETGQNTEQPSAAPIATEYSTENKEDSYNTVEIQSKPELASTGANVETYEQAARYVPNYVITASNTIQPLYNPYTAQMLLDLSLDAYQVIDPNYSEGWQRTLNDLGFTTRIATAGSTTYAVGEISNGDGVPSTPITLGNFHAIIGLKRVMYNDQEKYTFVIAFRGTKSIQDLIGTDFNFLPTAEGFHSGFRNCSKDFLYYFKNTSFSIKGETITGEEILNSMKTENSKYSVLVTGHSLGGAMADVFVGYDLYEMGVHPSNVMAYTFAAPTSAPSYYNYPYKNIINIINEDDFVPTVGASKRVGTDFCYTPDDAFRQAHYKNHYEEGHGTAWWSNIVNEAFHFVSHDLDKVYNPIIDYIQNHIDNYTSYHTNGDNTWNNNVTLDRNCYKMINGSLNVYSISFSEGSIEVTKDCTVRLLSMSHDTDYFLVGGNFTKTGTEINGGRLTDGTIEIKGDFYQKGTGEEYSWSYHYNYYPASGNHRTVFSGNSMQTITFDYPCSVSTFANLILENNNIMFASCIYNLTLMQNTELKNNSVLQIDKTLNLNGYSLTVDGELKVYGTLNIDNSDLTTQNLTVSSLNSTGGTINSSSTTISGVMTLSSSVLTVDGDLNAYSVIFNESRLEVTQDCTVRLLSMSHDTDYFLVGGNFTKTGTEINGGRLTDGTIEIKGDFYQKGTGEEYSWSYHYNYYPASGNHRTVFSGNSMQTITFDYPCSVSTFANLILDNNSIDGIAFYSPVRVNTLFDHNRNIFTLYNDGIGSTFVDYDGDGMLDNVDPYPTDPNNTPPTQEPTHPSTQEPTQAPTQPPTQDPTQPPTQEPTQAPTQESSNSPTLLGDVDGDGTVTIIDATCIQRHLASIPSSFAFIEALADTDGDGGTTIIDATFIQRWLANLPSNDNISKPIK